MYVFGVCSHLFGQNRPINPWLLKQNNNLHPLESSEGLICYYCLLVALKRASSYINLYSSKVRAWNGFLNVSQTIHFSVTVWAVYGHRWCWLIRIIAFLFSFFFLIWRQNHLLISQHGQSYACLDRRGQHVLE